MAKTVAEVHGFAQLLSERIDYARGQITELWAGHDLTKGALEDERKENARLRQEVVELRKELDGERSRGRTRDDVIAALQREVSALRQRSDDQTRQAEAWATRIWGFFVVLVGAVLSLASGLIVTLARK